MRELPLAADINIVATLNGINFLLLLSSLRVPYFSTRKKAARVLHGLLSHKNIMIPIKKKLRGPPLPPALGHIWADKGGYFEKLSYGSETLDMTS